jgi:hypothetical protein
VTRAIPKFWPVALMNHTIIAFHVTHNTDQVALSYLEDIWVEKDEKEPRCFSIEFVRLCSLLRESSRITWEPIAFQRKSLFYGFDFEKGV